MIAILMMMLFSGFFLGVCGYRWFIASPHERLEPFLFMVVISLVGALILIVTNVML